MRPRRQFADQYTDATGKQWTQFVGFVHALFEVCFDGVARAGSTDKQAIDRRDAAATNLDTIVGPIKYGADGLPKNVSPTSLVGGQWQQRDGGQFPFELLVVNNTLSPEIPINGTLEPLGPDHRCRGGTARRSTDCRKRFGGLTVVDRSLVRRCRG